MTLLEETKNVRAKVAPKANAFAQFELPNFLYEGLRRAGFEEPTSVQAEAIPTLMAGKDLIVQSQTGSGKTAAFGLPLLARVQRQSRDLQALVMVPTRELALQVTQVLKLLAGPAVRITPIYGGAGMEGQVRGLTQGGYQVVVGTPGRLRDHLNRGTLKLNRLRMLVLDEADEMLDQGFAQDVEAIIQATPTNGGRQTALFSATLPEWVMSTAAKYLKPDHASITLDPSNQTQPDIEHIMYDMSMADKTVALRHLLDTHNTEPVLVFLRTKHGVKKMTTRLENEGYSVGGLQGNLSQRAREEVMAAFRSRKLRILVATNVGARGLDVSGISHVINFDLPESAELFTHRVGRTARNGASGTAITFLTGEDRLKWREIERALYDAKVDFNRLPWDGPRAVPGAEPIFTQPQQRGFGQPRRNYRDDFQPALRVQEREFTPARRSNSGPSRPDFQSGRRDARPGQSRQNDWEREGNSNSDGRPPRRRTANYR